MNIIIADDHAIVRKGLSQLIFEAYPEATITEVTTGTEVLGHLNKQIFDLILMDISMPGRNGVETLKQIRTNGITTPVLILSAHSEEQYAMRVLKAGASGYLNKETAPEELLAAVNKVLSGKKYISPTIAEKLADTHTQGSKAAHEQLSDREMEVLLQIASGRTVSGVAEVLSLSVNTISTYRARLLEKLKLKNNAELTRFALDNGLI